MSFSCSFYIYSFGCLIDSSASSSIVETNLVGELTFFKDVDITTIKNELAFKEKDLFCT